MVSGWQALGYTFDLSSSDPASGAYYASLFTSLKACDETTAHFVVRPVASVSDDTYELVRDGEVWSKAATPVSFGTELVTEINAGAVGSWPGVVCHAGGVSHQGVGILLPADPESGKSTLTCGLVRAGFRYLTDEGVAFHPGTTHIEPYPKPLALDKGSWFLFPELEPLADLDSEDFERTQWLVPPTAIRSDAVGGPCDARYIVFPKYVESAETVLTPIGRAEALVELAKNTFEFNQHSREYLDQLAIVVAACDCYRLTVGTLADAVACIQELVGVE